MGVFTDVLLCVIWFVFVLSGFRRGFVRSLTEFVGCIAATVATAVYLSQFAAWLKPYFVKCGWPPLQNQFVQRLIATVLLFALLEALVQIVARVLDRIFHLPVLKQINSLLGGAFGLLKGAVVVVFLCAVLRLSPPAGGGVAKPSGPLQQMRVSRIYQTISVRNPIYTLFQTNHWNEVGRNGKQK